MNYAIIRSRQTHLLEVINVQSVHTKHLDSFLKVRRYNDNTIKLFEYEDVAIDFMFDNFSREMINPKYYSYESLNGQYYID